ncbi:MAG: tetratricopeptide repeat protein [Desulfobacterales bacterium]|nr:tetratricopeptide repeat protein [Desulfobacterales bacterium]
MTNPYIAGNPVGGTKNFIGREKLIDGVCRILENPNTNVVVLYGQRRIGKTSILQELVHQMPKKGSYLPVYFDLQDKAAWSLERILSDLSLTIADNIKFQISPDARITPDEFQSRFLPDILDMLPANTSLVLLFDEFDVLDNPRDDQSTATFFPYLRQLMKFDQQRLQFVFVIGRRFDELTTLMLQVFKEVESHQLVSLINKADMNQVARLSEQDGSVIWTVEALERLWELTHGHPFLIQQLCSVIWDSQQYEENTTDSSNKRNGVFQETVDDAVPETLARSANSLQWIWDGLPPEARIVASALAEAGPGSISQDKLEETLANSGVHVIIGDLKTAPEELKKWDLLGQDDKKDKDDKKDNAYYFRVELVRCWLVKNKPLSRVKMEMEQTLPLASSLYETGQGFYHAGQLDNAVNQLEQAIRINPNHLNARLLLAEIYLARGNISEALSMSEMAYDYDQPASRSIYVRSLLALAESLSQTPKEQFDVCERILKIDPRQPLTLKKQKELAVKFGNEALNNENFDAALEMFEIAGDEERISQTRELILQHELDQQIEKINQYKKVGDWDNVISIYKQLSDKYPQKKPWEEWIKQAEHQKNLEMMYKQAEQKFKTGHKEEATQILGRIIAENPNYTQAKELMAKALPQKSLFFYAKKILLVSGIIFVLFIGIWWVLNRNNSSKTRTITAFPNQITESGILEGHAGEVRTVAFSPDGAILASGDNDNIIRLWDIPNRKLLKTLEGHNNSVWSLAFSPKGRLASGSSDNTIKLWDVTEGKLLQTLEGHKGRVRSVAFNPDGTLLASGGDDNTVRIWNVVDSKTPKILHGHTSAVYSVAFNPDGTHLASGGNDNTVRIWNVADDKELKELSNHTNAVYSVIFSPEGKRLASASHDNIIHVWDVKTGEILQTLTGHERRINSLVFSSDGSLLISGSDDMSIRVWKPEREIPLVVTLKGHTGSVWSVSLSPDQKLLASGSGDKTIRLWGVTP